MTDYRKRLEAVLRETDGPGYRFINATITTEDLRSLLSEADSLRADITALEDGNMTFLCDQLDKAKAENAAQAVELERMRKALKVAEHDLVTTDNLRATDLSPVQMNGALNRGVALSDLEWMTDNSRGLAAIRQALSVKAG